MIFRKRSKRNCYKLACSSLRQEIELSTLGGEGIKGHGHTTPKLHVEAWRRHHYARHVYS